jgi:two-component system CheB/CheR fusion protein
MVLGSAESPGNFSNYFHTIDSKLRIYQKTQDLRIPVSSITSQGIRRGGYEPKTIPQYIERINKRTVKPRNRLIGIKTLQERFLPPTFIIDSKLQLIYSYGDTSFLTTKLKAGEVTNDIADILVPELTSHVLSAAHQVIRENNGILMESVFNQTDTNGELKSYSLNCFSFNE